MEYAVPWTDAVGLVSRLKQLLHANPILLHTDKPYCQGLGLKGTSWNRRTACMQRRDNRGACAGYRVQCAAAQKELEEYC